MIFNPEEFFNIRPDMKWGNIGIKLLILGQGVIYQELEPFSTVLDLLHISNLPDVLMNNLCCKINGELVSNDAIISDCDCVVLFPYKRSDLS